MATAPEEMSDLSKATGALLVNFGTIQNLDGMLAAGESSICHLDFRIDLFHSFHSDTVPVF